MNPRVNGGKTDLVTAIENYTAGLEAGNYRTNVDAQLRTWADWLRHERDVGRVGDVDVLDCRRYAAALKRRARNGEVAATTAHTYYAYVRSFLSWCVDEELVESNPARPSRATDELPEDLGDSDQQFWSPDDRRALFAHVSRVAHDALEDDETDEVRAFRDRALVYLLALSGVRGAEAVRTPADEKRTGIRWADVDIEGGAVRVLGKNRQYEHAQLPEQAADVLDRYRRVLDPPSGEWPVFPTGHTPSLCRVAREHLSDADSALDGDDVDDILAERDVDDVLREFDIVPPSITTDGARSIMKRLSEEADLDIDGEYLKPHGARRGLGDQLYRENPALAQQALRHKDLQTTHEKYSNIRASEVSTAVDDVLSSSDQP